VAYATLAGEGDNHQLTLYCDAATKIVDADVEQHLRDVNATIRLYASMVPDLQQYAGQASLEQTPEQVVWMDLATINYALTRDVPQTPTNRQLKTWKNSFELHGMKMAPKWPETSVFASGKWTIVSPASANFSEVSFGTIADVGSNGVIINYGTSLNSTLLNYLTVFDDKDDNSNVLSLDLSGQKNVVPRMSLGPFISVI